MMKKLLYLFAFVPALSFGQIFTENFDGSGQGIAAWTLINQDGLTPAAAVSFVTNAWVVVDRQGANNWGGPAGNNAALSTSWYNPAGTSNDWLISPSIAIPAGTAYLVWDAKAQDPDFPDGYQLKLSTNGGNTIADFDVTLYSTTGENTTWTTRNVDLSAYAGTNIRFAFVNNSTDAFVLLVDNISVTAEEPPVSYCGVSEPFDVEPISYFAFAGIDNTTSEELGETDVYEDFTAQVAQVNQGETYPVTVEGNTGGPYEDFITVFVDWNQDGSFDGADERYEIGSIDTSSGADGVQAVGSIAVPADALVGTTRLRVVKNYFEPNVDACTFETASWFGQVEDYSVNVASLRAPSFDNAKFKAYPNPVVNQMTVSYDVALTNVEVFNVVGQKVYAQSLNATEATINLSSLTSGTYFMKVHASDNAVTTVKVVRQ